MALTLRNSFPDEEGSGSAYLAAPTGVAANDLLLLLVVTNDDVIVTAPGGFQLVAEVTGTTRTSVFQKVATSDDVGASYWIRWPSGDGSVAICAVDSSTLTYAAVHQVATAFSNSASTSKIWTGVTNTDTNTLLLCFGGFGSSVSSTPDAAMTERIDANGPRVYMMSQSVAGSGATGTRTATGSSVVRQRCITISITESATFPITYDPEVHVTAAPVLAELEGEGVHVTAAPVLVEFAAIGIYVTAAPVLIELEYVEPPNMPTYFPSAAGTRAMHKLLPDEITGYAFDPDYSWWGTVVAEASINMIVNPSFEAWNVTEYDDSGNWADLDYLEFPAVGATAGRRCVRLQADSVTESWFEYDAGLAVTPGPYTWSLDAYVTVPGSAIVLEIRAGSTIKARRRFVINETGWQRYDISYVELGSGSVEVRLISPAANPAGLYIYSDAWQFEAKDHATTYFDGDNIGFNDVRPYQSYYWQGEAHRSASQRLETTGSGGRLVSWADNIGFMTTSIVGLGISPVDVDLEELADGTEINRGSRAVARTFTITGRIFAENHRRLINRENRLINLVRPNATLDGEQILLRYQQTDTNERLVGPPLDIVCAYTGGLEGNETNFYQQSYALQFRASQPHLRDVIDSSVELDLFKVLVENNIIFRDGSGEFGNLGTGSTNAFPTKVGWLRNGRPAAFGPFTTLAGDTVEKAAYWDGSNWIEMGTPTSSVNDVDDSFRAGYDLVVAKQDGNVSVYDVATDTWSDLDIGFDAAVHALDRDAEGNIWIGGSFIDDSAAVVEYNLVAKWNFDTELWETLGEGLSDPGALGPTPIVNTVLATNDGNVYFGGAFQQGNTSSSTTFAINAIRWDIETQTWDAMGFGFNEPPNQFVQGDDGYVYAVGPFDEDGTSTYDLRGFARWNGYQWEEMFPLVRVDGTFGADGVRVDENGVFWFFAYTTSVPDDLFDVPGLGQVGTFGWKNGVFYPPFSTTSVTDMAIGPGNRTIYAVRDIATRSDYLVAAHNTIEYFGTADAPLVINLQGPGHPYQIVNLTTKGGVYFGRDLEMGEGEIMTVRSDTQKPLIYSNMRNNMQRFMSAGPSRIKALRLRPGINRISIFMPEEDAENRAWAVWKNRYQTIAGPLNE